MSLAKRLLHPHYISNVVLASTYTAYQLITHPELLSSSSVAAYSRYILPAGILLTIKVRGSQSAEELVGVVALYIKVYSLYGFWSIARERATLWGMSWSGWWRVVLFLFAWFVVFITFPQPPYQGPSKIVWLDASQLEFLTTPDLSKSKGKGRASVLKNRSSTSKIVELDDNGDPLEDEQQHHDHDHYGHDHHGHDHHGHDHHGHDHAHHHDKKETVAELDPTDYWIIAFNATWSSPCRNFEAVLAGCSIKYDKKRVHFAKIDMDLVPEGDAIAERFKISLAATTLDLPTLILFKDGKALKQLPLKLGTTVGGE
ncbi:hypothetical protein BGZ98_008596, partial [Dissophora globulifera]